MQRGYTMDFCYIEIYSPQLLFSASKVFFRPYFAIFWSKSGRIFKNIKVLTLKPRACLIDRAPKLRKKFRSGTQKSGFMYKI